MSLLEEYKKLHPTKEAWEIYSRDPQYLWNGREYHPFFITPSKWDSEYVVWCYTNVPTIMEALAGVAKIKENAEKSEKTAQDFLRKYDQLVANYEESLKRLSTIIEKLESGDLMLIAEARQDYEAYREKTAQG